MGGAERWLSEVGGESGGWGKWWLSEVGGVVRWLSEMDGATCG